MVTKITCDHCKGDRYVKVTKNDGKTVHVKCPHCSGAGYKFRLR